MKRAIILILLLSFVPGIFSQEKFDDLFRAKSLFDRGMFGDAIAATGNSHRYGDDFRFAGLRGEAFIASGDNNRAIISFNESNMILEASGELGLARVYALLNDSKSSAYHLELHLKSSFRLPQRELQLDNYLKRIDESSEWKALWKRDWYTQLEEGVAEVEYLLEKNRDEEAATVAESFSGIYKDRAEVDYINGLLSFNNGRFENAAAQLKESIDKDQGKFKVWELYIESLGSAGDYVSAVNASGKAIDIFPERLSFYISRVEFLRKSGERSSAMVEVSDLLEYYPDNEKLVDLAGKIAFETRNYSQALKYLSDNIESHPGSPMHYSARGDVYLATQTWEFAIVDYTMALDLDPYNGDVYYKKGTALIEMGNIKDACHDLKAALKLGNRKASQLISKLCIE